MKITAVIPVRAGSTRLKNKNIRPFAGSNLLEIKIEQLKKIPEIGEIIVSSDSPEMLEIASKHGVTGKKRPIEFCDEKSRTFNEVVEYVTEFQVMTDVMMWVPCVCPLVSSEKIREGILKYKKIVNENALYDSVVSAVLIKEYLFDEKGPVNFSKEKHVPSQKLPDWHYIVNGFFIALRENMINWHFVYGSKPYLLELNKYEAIDIDDECDFKIAEIVYKTFQQLS